jgi:molybdopterin/thiamine biosynthesis adenylyltransferase
MKRTQLLSALHASQIREIDQQTSLCSLFHRSHHKHSVPSRAHQHATSILSLRWIKQTDVGKMKADVAARFISNRVPGMNVTTDTCPIQEKDEAFYAQFSVIIAGLDNIAARRWMNALLHAMVETDDDGNVDVETVIPFIDGGSEAFKGQARVIIPMATSCFECSIESFPPQTHFPLCTVAEVGFAWQTLHKVVQCIYMSVYLCIYVSMYLCIYVSMYLCIYVSMHLCIFVLRVFICYITIVHLRTCGCTDSAQTRTLHRLCDVRSQQVFGQHRVDGVAYTMGRGVRQGGKA